MHIYAHSENNNKNVMNCVAVTVIIKKGTLANEFNDSFLAAVCH